MLVHVLEETRSHGETMIQDSRKRGEATAKKRILISPQILRIVVSVIPARFLDHAVDAFILEGFLQDR